MGTKQNTVRVLGKDLRKGMVIRIGCKCTITFVAKTTRMLPVRYDTKGGTPYVFVKYTYVTDHKTQRTSSIGRPLFANHLYTVIL